MANTRKNLIEANKKSLLSPNIGKHGRAKKTIAREEARLFYQLKVLKILDIITDVQINAVMDIKNKEERMFVINQIIGKADETLNLINLVKPLPTDKADRKLKKLYGIAQFKNNRGDKEDEPRGQIDNV